MYDFSKAERVTFDLIPAKTIVPVIIAVRSGDAGTQEGAFTVTKTGLLQLTLECTVTDGPFAKRKIFHRIPLGAQDNVDLSEGQKKSIAIGESFLRSVLEAARGFAPTDESPAAIQARGMRSVFELDNMEVVVEIGIEKDMYGKFDDRNKINKVVPVKPGARAAATQQERSPQRKAAWA